MENISELTTAVANEFSTTIRKWLTPDELAEVIRLNAEDVSTQGRHNPNYGISICHTHDYCDAGMLMFEIIDRHLAKQYEQKNLDQGGLPDDDAEYSAFWLAWNDEATRKIQSPETTPIMTLWNAAWTTAKSNEFKEVK